MDLLFGSAQGSGQQSRYQVPKIKEPQVAGIEASMETMLGPVRYLYRGRGPHKEPYPDP